MKIRIEGREQDEAHFKMWTPDQWRADRRKAAVAYRIAKKHGDYHGAYHQMERFNIACDALHWYRMRTVTPNLMERLRRRAVSAQRARAWWRRRFLD